MELPYIFASWRAPTTWMERERLALEALARCREGRHEPLEVAGLPTRICRHCRKEIR
jgi:hypothetical protein